MIFVEKGSVWIYIIKIIYQHCVNHNCHVSTFHFPPNISWDRLAQFETRSPAGKGSMTPFIVSSSSPKWGTIASCSTSISATAADTPSGRLGKDWARPLIWNKPHLLNDVQGCGVWNKADEITEYMYVIVYADVLPWGFRLGIVTFHQVHQVPIVLLQWILCFISLTSRIQPLTCRLIGIHLLNHMQ